MPAQEYIKKYLAEKLFLNLGLPDEIRCAYSKFNNECLKEDCPYYNDRKEDRAQ